MDENSEESTSPTLKSLDLSPNSECADCQHAIWHKTVRELRIFCRLMHVLVDEPLMLCDGKFISPE